MGSLTDLNTFSNNLLPFTDNRPPGILLSYPTARDVPAVTRTGTSFDVQRNIDIVEIIDPNGTLNLTYSIDLSSVAGAYISWTTLFGGAITSSVGNVYSVSVIDSISDWELVRAPLINIPADFQGTFEYTCSLEYNTGSSIEAVSWTVGSFVPVSNLQGIFTTSITPTKFKGIVNETLDCGFTISGIGQDFDFAEATLPVVFDVDANVERIVRSYEANLTTIVSLTANLTYSTGNLSSNPTVISSVSCAPTKIAAISGHEGSLTYNANQRNQNIFSALTINTDAGPIGTVHRLDITLSSGSAFRDTRAGVEYTGSFSIESTTSAFFDAAQYVRGTVASLDYYADYNSTTNNTYQISYYIDNVLINQGSTSGLNYSGVTATIDDIYETRTSDEPFNAYTRKYHNRLDIYIFGGGGGGANDSAGGGGGSGLLIEQIGLTYVHPTVGSYNSGQPFSLTAGAGGGWGVGSFGVSDAGGQGGTTTFQYDPGGIYETSTKTAYGGFGGGDGSNGIGLSQGSNTETGPYSGGNGIFHTRDGTTYNAGGQGAGATGDGIDAYVSSYLRGGFSNNGKRIDGEYYGNGGAGESEDAATYRGDPRYLGSGGFGGIVSQAGDGIDGGIVYRSYRV